MEELRALPKAYAGLIAIKVVIALVVLFSIMVLAIGAVGIYLYTANYATHIVVLGVALTWLLFFLIFIALMLYQNAQVKSAKQELMQVANKELLALVALHSLNAVLRKLRHGKLS